MRRAVARPGRVVQVLGSSAGGVARHVAQLAELLAGAGAEVVVAGPTSVLDLVRPGPTVRFAAVEIADRPRRSDVTAVRALRRLAAGAEVVHAHGLRAGALAVVAARSCGRRRPRVVVTLHNLPVGPRTVRAVAAVLELVVARGADTVLGVSGDLVERVARRGARRTERALVPAPVRAAGDATAARATIAPRPGVAIVLTVARLAPQKGLDVLLDAAGLLEESALWCVAGDGPLADGMRRRIGAERLPVRLLGRRDDVPALLAVADVVVQTSVWEGQPLGMQEALRSGSAIVTTDAGGTREVTGDAAVLVPVGDAAGLARAVDRLLADADLRAERRASSLLRAAALPGPAQVLAQVLRCYGWVPDDAAGVHGAGSEPSA